MIIDGHTHLFSLDTERYSLGDPDSTYRPEADGSADTLKVQMDAAGVDWALTITAGFYGWDNSSTMDTLKGRKNWLAGGVLVDPAAEDGPDH
jgi:predicted TIM-barrel fold metal-dependent hydrolase